MLAAVMIVFALGASRAFGEQQSVIFTAIVKMLPPQINIDDSAFDGERAWACSCMAATVRFFPSAQPKDTNANSSRTIYGTRDNRDDDFDGYNDGHRHSDRDRYSDPDYHAHDDRDFDRNCHSDGYSYSDLRRKP